MLMRWSLPGKLLIALAMVLCVCGIPGGSSPAAAQANGYFRIVLLSDPHLPVRPSKDPDKQQRIIDAKLKVIEDINAWNDVGEIAVLGDITATAGTAEEYAYASQYFAKLTRPVAFITGNHDYIYTTDPTGKRVRGDAASRSMRLSRFKETFGLKELFHAQKVGNYLLVFLSIDSLDSPYLAQLSDRQLGWLRQELKENPTSPTVIFYHAPLSGTLETYNKDVNTPDFIAQPEQTLREIIAANPQIVLWVSGHTHTPADNPSFASPVNFYEGRVTNIHNPDMDRVTIWTNSLYLYPDKIVVKTFNHKTGAWCDELERTFPVNPR
jgi:Predicted phosphohydrolases